MIQWIFPLVCAVVFYGLAQGIYKQVPLSAGEFCLLFVAAKTAVNVPLGAWLARAMSRDKAVLRFAKVSMGGQLINGVAWISYFEALRDGPAAVVGTLTAAYTTVTVLLAALWLKERLHRRQVWGVLIVIVSSSLLAFGSEQVQLSLGHWFLYSVATMLLWGISQALFKYAYGLKGANDGIFFLCNWLATCVTLLPYGLLTTAGTPSNIWGESHAVLGSLAVVAFYTIGDLALFVAVHFGKASLVTPLSGLYPIVTLFYASWVLHEQMNALQWTAIGAVMVAIVLCTFGEQKTGQA